MKSTALLFLALLMPASLFAVEQIKVETKFLEADAPIPHDIAKINQMKGADLLSAPSVTTKSGQSATLSITHDFSPASVTSSNFPAVPTGITFQITPEIKEGRLIYAAHVTVCDLVSAKHSGEQTASETTSHELYISGTSKDGEAMWIELSDTADGKKRMLWLQFTRQGA